MFEHMIGKGTVSLGTKNWPEEEKALAAVETAYDKLEEERVKGRRSDKAQLERLEAARRMLPGPPLSVSLRPTPRW